MKIILQLMIISSIFLFVSCNNSNKNTNSMKLVKNDNTIILNYSDFGPQVRAYELIGMEWWSWDNHGDSRPREYDIKVIVYKDISLDEIKKLYPTIKDKEQDYRYLKYDDAIKYLNKHIGEEYSNHLIETKKKITEKLGK